MDVSESDLCAGTLAPAEALAEQLLKASSSLKTPRRASRMAQVQIAVPIITPRRRLSCTCEQAEMIGRTRPVFRYSVPTAQRLRIALDTRSRKSLLMTGSPENHRCTHGHRGSCSSLRCSQMASRQCWHTTLKELAGHNPRFGASLACAVTTGSRCSMRLALI